MARETATTEAQQYFKGTGRRKTAIAQVRLTPGSGTVVTNGKPIDEFFPLNYLKNSVLEPFKVTDTVNKYNAMVKVLGGGFSSQAGAVRHGIARALDAADDKLRPLLRKNGFMTRDPRIKERKKYGLKRARKAPQYTKR